jgi:hypothetical protein
MGDLASGVHSGVGAPGDGQPRRRRQPQHGGQRGFDLGLDGAQTWLAGPPGEIGPVVCQVEPNANEPGATL